MSRQGFDSSTLRQDMEDAASKPRGSSAERSGSGWPPAKDLEPDLARGVRLLAGKTNFHLNSALVR